MINYSIQSVYRTPQFNGYGKECAYKRFSFLKGLSFGSVLDVGSGACLLKNWLAENGFAVDYEAVDIRPDALALCKCVTHQTIPANRAYDLVCLFGTVTYNIDHDEAANKATLLHLLKQSKTVCRSLLLFTVFKESVRIRNKNTPFSDYFVCFSMEEIDGIMAELGIPKYTVVENPQLDEQEYFVLASVEA